LITLPWLAAIAGEMDIAKSTALDISVVFAITMLPSISHASAHNLKGDALFQPNLDLGFSSLH
jgi:hypothetical protein